jgi:hypothetical protein
MAKKPGSVRPQAVQTMRVNDSRVEITEQNRLQVEFRIDELVRHLVPGGGGISSCCGGCHGCSGCSM